MTTKHSVSVNIAGQKLTLRSDADETYVRTLARHVEQKLTELREQSRNTQTNKLLLLTALQLADEAFEERTKRQTLQKQVKERSQLLLNFLDREEEKILKTE